MNVALASCSSLFRLPSTIGTAFSYVDYQTFNGDDRDRVVLPARLEFDDAAGRPVNDQVLTEFKLRQSIYTFSVQFGLLDNLDVGLLIPVFDQSFRASVIDAFFATNPDGSFQPGFIDFDANGQAQFFPDERLPPVRRIDRNAFNAIAGDVPNAGYFFKDERYGVGDLLLRSKMFFGSMGSADLGGSLNLSVPTGDEDNLLGVGSVRFDPRLLVSTANSRFALHTNQGVHVDVDQSDRDRYDYSVGGEVLLAPWLTLLVDHIGRIEFSGEDKIRKFDIAPGIKINPYKSVVIGFNAIVPLNRSGLRTDFTPNATLEIFTNL